MSIGRLALWLLGLCLLIVMVGYLSSVMFFLWNGLDPDTARPWSIVESALMVYRDPRYHLSLGASIALPIIAIATLFIAPLFGEKPIYGDARWATEAERRKASLRANEGVLLGTKAGRYLCSDTATHTLLVGPTRAGKGTGIVVPNCLNWAGSLVVLDVKGENYKITAGFRAAYGHNVYFWSPMSKDNASHRYNPLDAVSNDHAHRVSDVQVIASLLVDVSDRDPMWGLEARALFVGLTLYVLEVRPEKTLGEVYRVLASAGDLRDVCEAIVETNPGLSAEAQRSLGSFAAKSPKEASSVRSNLQSALRLFENPVVDAATRLSDFSLRDLRKRRISIYVGALASQLDTIAPLLRLFFQQIIAILSEKEPAVDEPHKVLMLLDEFPALGRMDAVVTAFTLLAGYNVRILAVLQGLTWLDRNYGRDTRDGIVSCCGNQVFMTTNDDTTSHYISTALGDQTVQTRSKSSRPWDMRSASSSRNIGQTGRPLLTKQEIRNLNRKKQIIIVEGHRPTLANKIQYFSQRAFKKRLLDPPPIPPLEVVAHKAAPATAVSDDGGPIVEVPPPPSSPSSTPSTATPIAPAPKPTIEQEFFAIVEQEAAENPHFKATNEKEIARLRELDVENLI